MGLSLQSPGQREFKCGAQRFDKRDSSRYLLVTMTSLESFQSSGKSSEKCPIREAVRFLAGAWTLEIYWNLRSGPMRFGELRRQLVGVSPKVLTQRLRDLEDLGVLLREVQSQYPPHVAYSLTPLGLQFVPILDRIAEVGSNLTRRSRSAGAVAAPEHEKNS